MKKFWAIKFKAVKSWNTNLNLRKKTIFDLKRHKKATKPTKHNLKPFKQNKAFNTGEAELRTTCNAKQERR